MKFNKILAAFADKQLEKEFLEHEREGIVKYFRPLPHFHILLKEDGGRNLCLK